MNNFSPVGLLKNATASSAAIVSSTSNLSLVERCYYRYGYCGTKMGLPQESFPPLQNRSNSLYWMKYFLHSLLLFVKTYSSSSRRLWLHNSKRSRNCIRRRMKQSWKFQALTLLHDPLLPVCELRTQRIICQWASGLLHVQLVPIQQCLVEGYWSLHHLRCHFSLPPHRTENFSKSFHDQI